MADFTTAIGDVELNDWHGSKLLAQPVLDALTRFTSEGIINPAQILGVSENLDEESDTDIFCPRHGLDLAQAGNVVIVHTHKTRKAPPQFAAALVNGDARVNLNGLVKHTLQVSKVSFAPVADATAATGMESGGMSPIGLPPSWPVLVDARILETPTLFIGSGIRLSKLVVNGALFAYLPGVRVIEGLGKPRG